MSPAPEQRGRFGPDQWTLVATILASSMTFIDATVVNVALPALQADLHATITDVQWVVEAYALFLGALILVGGSLVSPHATRATTAASVTAPVNGRVLARSTRVGGTTTADES